MLALTVVPREIGVWMWLIGIIGGGIIGISYAVAALAAAAYPATLRAGGIGTASAVGRFGATLGPAVGGWLIGMGVSVVQIFAGLVLPMAVGIVLVLLFTALLPKNTAPEY